MYEIRMERARGIWTWERETAEDAEELWAMLTEEVKPGCRYTLALDGRILREYPPIPATVTFRARTRVNNQASMSITIPAEVRDSMNLVRGEDLDVVISRVEDKKNQ